MPENRIESRGWQERDAHRLEALNSNVFFFLPRAFLQITESELNPGFLKLRALIGEWL